MHKHNHKANSDKIIFKKKDAINKSSKVLSYANNNRNTVVYLAWLKARLGVSRRFLGG